MSDSVFIKSYQTSALSSLFLYTSMYVHICVYVYISSHSMCDSDCIKRQYSNHCFDTHLCIYICVYMYI